MPENAHKPRKANPTIRLALAGMMALRRGDAAEAQSLLADAFPKLDAKGLEDLLARALFVSELWGRISAGR